MEEGATQRSAEVRSAKRRDMNEHRRVDIWMTRKDESPTAGVPVPAVACTSVEPVAAASVPISAANSHRVQRQGNFSPISSSPESSYSSDLDDEELLPIDGEWPPQLSRTVGSVRGVSVGSVCRVSVSPPAAVELPSLDLQRCGEYASLPSKLSKLMKQQSAPKSKGQVTRDAARRLSTAAAAGAVLHAIPAAESERRRQLHCTNLASWQYGLAATVPAGSRRQQFQQQVCYIHQ